MRDSLPCLRLFLLGPAFVEWRGQRLAIPRRRARALLYRLAAQTQPVPREELCFTFWPDVPEAYAHRQLSHLLSQLRQSLPLPSIIRARNELVELDWESIWSDSVAFSSACAPYAGDPRLLSQALELYRGPFMSGFPLPACPEFGSWVASQRTLYQRLYLDALLVVINNEARESNYHKAIFYARRYLRVNELAEDIHRQLMLLHLQSGDRPSALQQYERCVSVLERELGIGPLPETRAMYRAIRDDSISA